MTVDEETLGRVREAIRKALEHEFDRDPMTEERAKALGLIPTFATDFRINGDVIECTIQVPVPSITVKIDLEDL